MTEIVSVTSLVSREEEETSVVVEDDDGRGVIGQTRTTSPMRGTNSMSFVVFTSSYQAKPGKQDEQKIACVEEK